MPATVAADLRSLSMMSLLVAMFTFINSAIMEKLGAEFRHLSSGVFAMKKRRKGNGDGTQQKPMPPDRILSRPVASALVAAATALIALSVGAANSVLHGHISKTVHPSDSKVTVSAPATPGRSTDARIAKPMEHTAASSTDSGDSSLVAKYGEAATSPAIADAIRRFDVATAAGKAKAAADRSEALSQGIWKPGADPMMAIMYGYIPPGMPPEQAAMLARSLPKLPKMSGHEDITRMAGEPADPMTAISPDGADPRSIATTNQKMLDDYLRDRLGPVNVPPFHVDHNWFAQHARSTGSGYVSEIDHQSVVGLCDASGNEITSIQYDPWGNQTVLHGGTTMPDFGFQGMYLHPRSGNYLTLYRVYNPALGRWLSRDPIADLTFRMRPRSPERSSPTVESTDPLTHVNRAMAPLLKSTHDPILATQLAKIIPRVPRMSLPPDVNPYVFVANNPVNWRDPLGLAIGSGGQTFPHCPFTPPGEGRPPFGNNDECHDWCFANYTEKDLEDCFAWCDQWYEH